MRLSPGSSMRTKRAGFPVTSDGFVFGRPVQLDAFAGAAGLVAADFAAGLGSSFFVLAFAGMGLSKPAYISGLMPFAYAPPPNVFGLNGPTKSIFRSAVMASSRPSAQKQPFT